MTNTGKIDGMTIMQEEVLDEGSTPLPDRLCAEAGSSFYNAEVLPTIEIWIDGALRQGDVIEYCISGKWARVYRDGFGSPIRTLRDRDIRVEWKR